MAKSLLSVGCWAVGLLPTDNQLLGSTTKVELAGIFWCLVLVSSWPPPPPSTPPTQTRQHQVPLLSSHCWGNGAKLFSCFFKREASYPRSCLQKNKRHFADFVFLQEWLQQEGWKHARAHFVAECSRGSTCLSGWFGRVCLICSKM